MAIPLIATLGGGLLGMISGDEKAKEAARRERINQQLGSLDTKFGSLVSAPSTKVAQTEAGPGAFGGLLSGALSGFNQAQAIGSSGILDSAKDGLVGSGQDVYKSLLQKRSPNLGVPGIGAGQSRYMGALGVKY